MSRYNAFTDRATTASLRVSGAEKPNGRELMSAVEPIISSWIAHCRIVDSTGPLAFRSKTLTTEYFTAQWMKNNEQEIITVVLKPPAIIPPDLRQRIVEEIEQPLLVEELPTYRVEEPTPYKPEFAEREDEKIELKEPEIPKRLAFLVFHSDNRITAWDMSALDDFIPKGGLPAPLIDKALSSKWDWDYERDLVPNLFVNSFLWGHFTTQIKNTQAQGAVAGLNLKFEDAGGKIAVSWTPYINAVSPENGLQSAIGTETRVDQRETRLGGGGIPVYSDGTVAVIGSTSFTVGRRMQVVNDDVYGLGDRDQNDHVYVGRPSFVDSEGNFYIGGAAGNITGYTENYEAYTGSSSDDFFYQDLSGDSTGCYMNRTFLVNTVPHPYIRQEKGLDIVEGILVPVSSDDFALTMCFDGECYTNAEDIFFSNSMISFGYPYRYSPDRYTLYHADNGSSELNDQYGNTYTGFYWQEDISHFIMSPICQVSNGEHMIQGFHVHAEGGEDGTETTGPASTPAITHTKYYFDGNNDFTSALTSGCGCEPRQIQYLLMNVELESIYMLA